MVNNKDCFFALDIGTRGVKGIYASVSNEELRILCESTLDQQERAMEDGQIHDIEKVSQVVKKVKEDIEGKIGHKLDEVSIAAAGRSLKTVKVKSHLTLQEEKTIDSDTIRALELQGIFLGEEEIKKQGESLYCVGYSVTSYFLNGYLISNLLGHTGEYIEVELIATFLPKSVVDSLYAVMDKVGLKVANLTLEPIAAMEAVIPEKLRLLNIALVDIGAGTSDIAICSKNTIKAYGMVPIAGNEITEAIALELMVDYSQGEAIKMKLLLEDTIIYKDVLDLENQISSKELLHRIMPAIEDMAMKIGKKILELNDNIPPGAVFLVGGGAHTPLIKDSLSKILGLKDERLAVRDRKNIDKLIHGDNSLGSIGVTVVGIAMTASKSMTNNFINIYVNNKPYTIFNRLDATIKDALLSAGISPKELIFKKGKNLHFTLNGVKKVVFGDLGSPAEISLKGSPATLDSTVKSEDSICFKAALDGLPAEAKVSDFLIGFDCKRITFKDKDYYLEPIIRINGNIAHSGANISDGDIIVIDEVKTLGDLMERERLSLDKINVNGLAMKKDYIINEGDIITDIHRKEKIENFLVDEAGKEKIEGITIRSLVNGEEVFLRGKDSYAFIDIFDFYSFDLSSPKGIITLELNGSKAGYYDSLKDGDIIKIYWRR